MKIVLFLSAICHCIVILLLANPEPASFMTEFLDQKYSDQSTLKEADVSFIICTIPECFSTIEVQGLKSILLATDLKDSAANQTITALFKKRTGSWLFVVVFLSAIIGAILTIVPLIAEF